MTPPEAAEEEVSEREGKGPSGPDSGHVEGLVQSPPSKPGPRLGEDLEAYVLQPAPQGHMVQCRISRNKRDVDRGMFPFYHLYLEAEEGLKVRARPPASQPEPRPLLRKVGMSRNPGLAGHLQGGPAHSHAQPWPSQARNPFLMEPRGLGRLTPSLVPLQVVSPELPHVRPHSVLGQATPLTGCPSPQG